MAVYIKYVNVQTFTVVSVPKVVFLDSSFFER